jgi:hypothetical protein
MYYRMWIEKIMSGAEANSGKFFYEKVFDTDS